MSGPDHFANAESDLEHAARAADKGRLDDVAYWMQAAQVHATLALAAATAFCGGSQLDSQGAAWAEVCGGAS